MTALHSYYLIQQLQQTQIDQRGAQLSKSQIGLLKLKDKVATIFQLSLLNKESYTRKSKDLKSPPSHINIAILVDLRLVLLE